jgi:hypothetical protein
MQGERGAETPVLKNGVQNNVNANDLQEPLD